MLKLSLAVVPAAIVLACAIVILAPMSAFAAQCVIASYYGTESGSVTANGEKFTGRDMTAAHKTLPFDTKLRVTYQGKSVVVRVNDRGPYIRGRSLDLSKAAAQRIGMVSAGVGRVCMERV